MGQYEAGVYIVLVIFLGIIVFTALIIRFKSQEKKSWRCEAAMRSWDRRSMCCVTIWPTCRNTHEHSWPTCRNASTLQSACSPPGVRRKRTEVGDRLTG